MASSVQQKGIDSQTILDGLGQAVLVFDKANRLVTENRAARSFLGVDYKLVRSEGWSAMVMLLNLRPDPNAATLDVVRAEALNADRPIRFQIERGGERMPCWASVVQGEGGEVYTMISIETPDWSVLSELLDHYLGEVREAVSSTQGHADLIGRTVRQTRTDGADRLARQVSGFTRLIDVHMHRLSRLTEMMARLAAIRTGTLRAAVRSGRRKLNLANFIEDFMEMLDEAALIDPETDMSDCRGRTHTDVPASLVIAASPSHLHAVLRDVLRNAIMYSMKATPVRLTATLTGDHAVQIDIADEGYGIRAGEVDRIFMPFVRARQPQIISEFGYGLSLYLCKHEIEAMGGYLWLTSEEGVGTTVRMKLPAWKEGA
jgi:signal transduction histidine kinase